MRRQALVSLLLVAVTGAVYLPVRNHDFVNYDDRVYILENPNLSAGLSGVVRAFTTPYETNWIPLTWISLQLDYALHELEPAGYHLTNFALHILSTWLLLSVLVRMTGALGPSAFAAAVFALHPLHVESVAWASERKDVLSAVFFMLALHAYVSWTRRPESLGRYLLVAVAMLLGLLAKPMLVTLPFVLLLLDYWPLARLGNGTQRAAPDPRRLGRAVVEKIPLFAIAAAVCFVTFQVQRETGAMAPEPALPLGPRLQNALHSYVWYALKSFWPSGLAVFYPHPLRSLPLTQSLGAGVLLAGATAAAIRAAASRPWWIVGWLWMLGTLVPVIGLIQVGMQARADRYMYLPLIGASLAVAWGARDLLRGRRFGRNALSAAGVASMLVLALVSSRQLAHWRDTEALFQRALAVTDDNFVAHHGLAGLLLLQGRTEEAGHHYAEAARMKPRWPAAELGLGEVLEKQGDLAGALRHFEKAVELAPKNARARVQLGMALLETGHPNRAARQLRVALERAREVNRPRIHAQLARALTDQGDLDAALDHYRRAVALDPALGEARANLGLLLIRMERPEEARPQLARADALGVQSADLQISLAELSLAAGEPELAVRHFYAALALAPESRTAGNNLAWLLATHPSADIRQPEEAIRIARAALAQDAAPHPALLDTLAAGCAAAGRFDEAVRVAREASQRARAVGRADLASEIEGRLAMYREGRAWVETPH